MGLMVITHYLPLTGGGAWLIEKLFGVITYIALGFVALSRRRPRSQQSHFITFLPALVMLFTITQLAIIRIPILGQGVGSLADFELNKAPLCDGMALIPEQVHDDLPSRLVEEEPQRLLCLAQEGTASSWGWERQAKRLLALLHGGRGFNASQGTYRLSDALRLDKVLVSRQGSTVSLDTILLWIVQRLALPAVSVIFPTQMLLRADPEASKKIWLINPFNDETLSEHTLEV